MKLVKILNKTKKNIVDNITKDIDITNKNANFFLDSFLDLIKTNLKEKQVKLSKFGSFELYVSPKRIGRNPKTLKSYIINKHKKVRFRAHAPTKGEIN
ncbi:MAG: hypothetical protein CML84_01780 [Rhodobiaceae bacterium]|nr:hypothetical protein [Rhodobiaceae bacterium]